LFKELLISLIIEVVKRQKKPEIPDLRLPASDFSFLYVSRNLMLFVSLEQDNFSEGGNTDTGNL